MRSPARLLERFTTGVKRSGLLRPTTVKVAAFAVVCLLVLAVLAAKIGHITFFAHRTEYAAQLSDVTGLQPGNSVKIAGVKVGQVDSIGVQRGHALVHFSVDNRYHLSTATRVGLQWHNVLGQQYLYLYPSRGGRRLPPGGTLPMSQEVSTANVGQLLNALGPLLSAIHPQQANQVVVAFAQALQGNTSQVDALINNAARVSHTIGSVDTQVGQVIGSLNQVFSALASRSSSLGQAVGNLQTLAATLAQHNTLLDQTVANLGQVSGELATLEGSTHNNLTSAINDLQAVASTIQAHETQLSQGLSTLGAGLAPYTEMSSYGQWFQVQAVYSCLAGETSCSYYQPTNAPSGTGFGGSAPPGSSPPGPAGSSSPLGGLGVPSSGASAPSGVNAVAGILDMVAGTGGGSGGGS